MLKKKDEKKYKVGYKEATKLIYRYAKKKILEQIKAVAIIVVYLILFQTIVLRIPLSDASIIAVGLVLVVVGLTFFMEGLLLGLMTLGEVIGIKLPQKTKLPVILIIAFILGIGATYAEPAIGVLKVAGSSVKAWDSPLLFLLLNKFSNYLVYSVGIGVGIAVVFGMLRFLYGWSLKPFIYVLITTLIILSIYAHSDPNLRLLLGLAWDCGGVTTGPVTVPLVLALGIGISHVASGGEENSGGGFGVVTLASLFPIIAVLIVGIVLSSKVPNPMTAKDFFDQKNLEKVIYLFQDSDDMKGYALKNISHELQLQMFSGNSELLLDYVKKISNNQILLKKLFGEKKNFEMWVLEKGTIDQQHSVFGMEQDLDKKRSKFLKSNSGFNKIDFFSRSSKSAMQAIIPLSLFLILILFIILRERLPKADEIFLGLFFAVIGMAIFNGGIEIGLSKIGDQIGSNLPASFSAIELRSEETDIKNFNPEIVNTAVMPDGTIKNFFYIYRNNEYSPILYKHDNYNKEQNTYRYIPTRGPLFGGKERSFLGILVVLIFSFIMGYGATLAEPALNALGLTVEEITVGTFKKSLLMQAVAIGVGIGIMAGVAKIIWDLPLIWMLVPPYVILLIITFLSSEEFVNIGWDSAGVTTGPITVPLVLAMGLGIGSQVGVVEGFGILTMASVFPIISVLSVGLFVDHKRNLELKNMNSDSK